MFWTKTDLKQPNLDYSIHSLHFLCSDTAWVSYGSTGTLGKSKRKIDTMASVETTRELLSCLGAQVPGYSDDDASDVPDVRKGGD